MKTLTIILVLALSGCATGRQLDDTGINELYRWTPVERVAVAEDPDPDPWCGRFIRNRPFCW